MSSTRALAPALPVATNRVPVIRSGSVPPGRSSAAVLLPSSRTWCARLHAAPRSHPTPAATPRGSALPSAARRCEYGRRPGLLPTAPETTTAAGQTTTESPPAVPSSECDQCMGCCSHIVVFRLPQRTFPGLGERKDFQLPHRRGPIRAPWLPPGSREESARQARRSCLEFLFA